MPGDRHALVMMDRRAVLSGLAAATGGSAFAADPVVEPITETTTFTTRGRLVRAALYRPAETTPRGGVVYMHGSGSVGPNQLRYAEGFARRGMLSLVPVYTDAAPDDGVRSRPVMQAWRDCAEDAVRWLIEQGAPADRVALSGYSLGSHIAVDTALATGPARAAIGITAGWDVYPPRRPRRRVPVLIIRASSDDHVSPASTDRLIAFLRDADVPVREAVIADAEHLMSQPQWAQVSARSLDFLSDQLDLPAMENR